eukprot:15443934-Alexandrium_andersonii.AAC.1
MSSEAAAWKLAGRQGATGAAGGPIYGARKSTSRDMGGLALKSQDMVRSGCEQVSRPKRLSIRRAG